jgi:hypothetical protein
MFYKMNYYENLPLELQYEIGQYVPYKHDHPPHFLREFQEIVVDWYNKTQLLGTDQYVSNYRSLERRYGLSIHQSNNFKHGVFRHLHNTKYYHMIFCYSAGRFKIISLRRPALGKNSCPKRHKYKALLFSI